jgi:hypothetical protein
LKLFNGYKPARQSSTLPTWRGLETRNGRDAVTARNRKSEATGNTNFDLNRRASPRPYSQGACGNVSVMGAGLRPHGKPWDQPPYPKMQSAPYFYPDRSEEWSRSQSALSVTEGCGGSAEASRVAARRADVRGSGRWPFKCTGKAAQQGVGPSVQPVVLDNRSTTMARRSRKETSVAALAAAQSLDIANSAPALSGSG